MNEKEIRELILEITIQECQLWQASYYKYAYEMWDKRKTYLGTEHIHLSEEYELMLYKAFNEEKLSQRNSRQFFQE